MDTIRAKGQEIRSKRRVGKTGTKAQRHKGTKAQRGKGTKAQRGKGTKAQRHKGTKAQRHKGTKAQRGKGPGSRRIGRYGELCAKSSKTVLIKMVYELGRR
ncbi:MAG: hypothetical protein KKE01_03825 [Candidatus Omnitrophica bacterium]|nr:hypothetical protein [Candidatus Omnitrophota bacterium]